MSASQFDEFELFYQHHQRVGNYPVTEAVERWRMMRANQAREALEQTQADE